MIKNQNIIYYIHYSNQLNMFKTNYALGAWVILGLILGLFVGVYINNLGYGIQFGAMFGAIIGLIVKSRNIKKM